MKLSNPDFDKRSYLKSLESINYLMLAVPLVFFGWVFLEKEQEGGLRNAMWDDPDLVFHGVMLVGVLYIFNRTLMGWKSTVLKTLSNVPEMDEKLRIIRKPLIWRNVLWSIGALISAYGLYEKGDMFYTLFFTVFLILITSNRPSGHFFSKLLKLKEEEKKWMESYK